MMALATEPSTDTQVKALVPVCPFRSQAVLVSHVVAYLPQTSASLFAELLSHPAIHQQTLASLRISETRSHQKRGPPANPLS
jgi:hypothetical protein